MNAISNMPGAPAQTAEALPSRDGLQVFTDGSCEPGSGMGGWAFVVYRDGAEIAAQCGGARQSRDNAMELTALLNAMLWLNGNASGENAVVWSDCVYAVKGCNDWRQIWRNNGWRKIAANAKIRNRTIANAQLWMAIDQEISRNPRLTVAWCKGHSGLVGNERADTLAALGRQSAAGGG